MGTHPIFESDFDCLTEVMSETENQEQTVLEDIENQQEENEEEAQIIQAEIFELELDPVDSQTRYWFYCRDWKLGRVVVKDVYPTVIEEVSTSLCPDVSDFEFYAKTEDENGLFYWRVSDVEDGWAICHSFDGLVEEQQIPLTDITPVYTCEEDRPIAEERLRLIDMFRFFMDSIIRPWDQFDEDLRFMIFEPLLRQRLNFYSLMTSEIIPRHAIFKYDRLLLECLKAKEEREAVYGVMQQVQNRLKVSPNDGSRGRNEEEDFFERVQEEFFRQEYLWKLLTNRRQALEEDIPIALANCFEGDEIVLFPGVYDLTDVLFHESITIRGAGESPDDVVLLAEANESSFVFADAENVTFRNLTFEARRNSDGAVVVNGGKCTIDSCILNCDEVTLGIIVRPFATCEIENSKIRGPHESSVTVEPGATFIEGSSCNMSLPVSICHLPAPKVTSLSPRPPVPSPIAQKDQVTKVDPAEGAGDTLVN